MAELPELGLTDVFPNQFAQSDIAYLDSTRESSTPAICEWREVSKDGQLDGWQLSIESAFLNLFYATLANSPLGQLILNKLSSNRYSELQGDAAFIVIAGPSPGLLVLHDQIENQYPETAGIHLTDLASPDIKRTGRTPINALSEALRGRLRRTFGKREIAYLSESIFPVGDYINEKERDLQLAYTIVSSVARWALPYFGIARMPVMELMVASPALDVRSNGKRSTAGAFVRDGSGQKVVTLAYHGTGPAGTSVTIDGTPSTVSDSDVVMDTSIAPYEWSQSQSTQIMAGAPWRTQPVHFDGVVSGPTNTQILASDMPVPNAPAGQQLRVYTPNAVNRGDSGSALFTDNDELVGFAFSKTQRGQPIQFASWIWAKSAYKALKLV